MNREAQGIAAEGAVAGSVWVTLAGHRAAHLVNVAPEPDGLNRLVRSQMALTSRAGRVRTAMAAVCFNITGRLKHECQGIDT